MVVVMVMVVVVVVMLVVMVVVMVVAWIVDGIVNAQCRREEKGRPANALPPLGIQAQTTNLAVYSGLHNFSIENALEEDCPWCFGTHVGVRGLL